MKMNDGLVYEVLFNKKNYIYLSCFVKKIKLECLGYKKYVLI